MGAKVAKPALRFHPKPAPSRNVRTAVALGVSEPTAAKKLAGPHAVNVECATIIAADLRAGDYESVAVFLAPIDAALAGHTDAPTLDAIWESAEADCGEDIAEAAYHKHPCAETAKALIRASALERMKAERREAALRREWGL
jgi:hypothetical protein